MQKIVTAILILFISGGLVLAANPLTWPLVFGMIADRFPNLPEKTVADVIRLQKSNIPFYLFDVRKKKEFQVSHIKGARNLTSASQIEKEIPEKDALIIVYCSVGYRSAAVVEDLRTKLYYNSFNMRGSIFEWANSGHKVYRNGKETSRIHPYNKKWGALLKKEYHYEIKSFRWW